MGRIWWPFYKVRWARAEEWGPAMEVVWRTFVRYEGRDYSAEGIENFLEFITSEELYADFRRGEYRLMVALDGKKIIGAGSLRGRNRLSLLFVEEAYQHRGVGRKLLRKLCGYLRTELGERRMFLQAAPGAVDFYRKEGFYAVQPEREYAGIRVTLMEKVL